MDGLSHTSLVSEWLLGDHSRDPRRTNFHTPKKLSDSSQFDDFVQACINLNVETARIAPHPKGGNWLIGDFSHTLYNHVIPLNGHTCLNGTGVQIGAWTAGSDHNGGVCMLFADGHMNFLQDRINLEVWRALSSRDGGETLDNF